MPENARQPQEPPQQVYTCKMSDEMFPFFVFAGLSIFAFASTLLTDHKLRDALLAGGFFLLAPSPFAVAAFLNAKNTRVEFWESGLVYTNWQGRKRFFRWEEIGSVEALPKGKLFPVATGPPVLRLHLHGGERFMLDIKDLDRWAIYNHILEKVGEPQGNMGNR